MLKRRQRLQLLQPPGFLLNQHLLLQQEKRTNVCLQYETHAASSNLDIVAAVVLLLYALTLPAALEPTEPNAHLQQFLLLFLKM